MQIHNLHKGDLVMLLYFFTLIENTDIMQNIYITVPHVCFMTYM